MMRRYWTSEKGQREVEELSKRFPTLRFSINENDSAYITGSLPGGHVQYSMSMVVPAGYPRRTPIVGCDSGEIPWIAERHVFSSGRACLCARIETRKHWPHGSGIADFIEALVVPFFICQNYFEAFDCWPPELGRSHDAEGIIEAARDVTASLGNLDEVGIIRTLQLLARSRRPGGHEPCPCGSGLKLRKCHSSQLWAIREHVDPVDAAADLATILDSKKPNVAA